MMKSQRFFLAIILGLGLWLLAGAAWGSIIEDEVSLNRVSQLVNLKGVSTTGEIKFNDLKRVMPDGSEVPFVIPQNRALLMVRFFYDFKPDTPPAGINVRIVPFALWINSAGFVNNISSAITTWPVGLPIGGPTDNYKIQAVYYNGTSFAVIPGPLTVYITGMIINPAVSVSPIEYMLLLN